MYLKNNVKYLKNVLDQIKLWEKDINRIECFDSCLFGDFSNMNDFMKSLEFSKRHNFHLWDDGNSKFIVKLTGFFNLLSYININFIGYEEMKSYIKSLKHR